jgi:DNA-binding transcriptional regulator YiaG
MILSRDDFDKHIELTADLELVAPLKSKYTVRQVRVSPKPSLYPPLRVRAVQELIGASQEVFAQLLAVSPMTVRSWEQGLRRPSPIEARSEDSRRAPKTLRDKGHLRASFD